MTNFQRYTFVIGLFALAGGIAAWWPGNRTPHLPSSNATALPSADARPTENRPKATAVDIVEPVPFFMASAREAQKEPPTTVTALKPSLTDEPAVEPFFTPVASSKTSTLPPLQPPDNILPRQVAPTDPTANDLLAARVEALERERRQRFDALEQKWRAFETTWQNWQIERTKADELAQFEIDNLRAQLRQLQATEKSHAEALPAPRTVVELPKPIEEPPPQARLQLSNEYGEEATININGTPYRLAPGEARTVTVPAGAYSFQVLPWQKAPQERTIAAGEERPIRLQKPKQ